MPYISKKLRNLKIYDSEIEDKISDIIIHISNIYHENDFEGICNYCISRIVAGVMKPDSGWRYRWLNRAHGTFFSAAAEFYRRVVAPYEDECIKKNGDISEYMSHPEE